MADYLIEENVEKVQETADEKVDGLSAETKENVIIPRKLCGGVYCFHVVCLSMTLWFVCTLSL